MDIWVSDRIENNLRKEGWTIPIRPLNGPIYFKGEKAAELKAIELSYDDGKLVYEATFVLTSSKYNDYAIEIIKVARKQKAMKDWDIEVELQY